MSILYAASIMLAMFLLGVMATTVYRYYQTDPDQRRASVLVSTAFVLIGIVVTFDLIFLTRQFNSYVRLTQLRDTAQERCQLETLESVENYQVARLHLDAGIRPMFVDLIETNGASISPDHAARALEALDAFDQQIRKVPPPDCDLGVKPKR